MTYRQLAHYVLKSGGRMVVSNPEGAGPMRLRVEKGGQFVAEDVAPTLDLAAARVERWIRDRNES